MSRPTRATAAGRAYLDLQNRARREKRPTQELLTLYVLERWLARLAASEYASSFVLKGGMLLAVFHARRPTVDGDLLARDIAADEVAVAAAVEAIARVELVEDDGVDYLVETLSTEPIRDEAAYGGVRVALDCRVSRSAVKLKLDINVGDPVTPRPQRIELPSQRPGYPAVNLLGYPVETVLAEKACTAIALGEANTRVRDYVDLYTLTGRYPLDHTAMRAALSATAGYRGVDLVPLSEVIGDLSGLRQLSYRTFRERLGRDGSHLPDTFSEVVAATTVFADSLIRERDAAWDPEARRWNDYHPR